MDNNFHTDLQNGRQSSHLASPEGQPQIAMALLTGGSDKPYVFGLTTSLAAKGAVVDLIGSDELDCSEYRTNPRVKFLNLRGDQRSDVGFAEKTLRILNYYARLVRYAATAKPKVFHILWNNKFEYFDRTLLMLYYRALGKKIVFTAHNVNAAKRDFVDSWANRVTLRIQYRLAHRIFIHTEKMRQELIDEFGVSNERITVIPFGINNAVPNTDLTTAQAKRRLGLLDEEPAILFFGRITPYKGLEYLIDACRKLWAEGNHCRLIIAGRVDRCEKYWEAIRQDIQGEVQSGRIVLKADYIADEETEVYFKAADVLVLPYKKIYQSGVLFLAHSFGLPVAASDVGSLKDDIVEGKTGLVFQPEDSSDLANALRRYFASELCKHLGSRRRDIQDFAAERHSWDTVAQITMSTYGSLLQILWPQDSGNAAVSTASFDANTP
jgi:D-inositol-3-phosphate glycosyltransferase